MYLAFTLLSLIAAAPADVIVTDAAIYTADPARRSVQSIAIRDGKILYAGDAAGAAAYQGPNTQVERYGGRLIVPGLVDAHVHPAGVVQLDVCDLRMQTMTLAQIHAFAVQCLARYKPAPGQWLTIENWNSDAGNQPDARFANSRAALDAASASAPIQLADSNGHRSGYNSAALALARNAGGLRVGLSRGTLRSDFQHIRSLVGVDGAGNPDGLVMEDARDLLDAPDSLVANLDLLMQAPERMVQVFNRAGITAIQEAAGYPPLFDLYDRLERDGRLALRVNIAQYYNPKKYTDAGGNVDFDRMIAAAQAGRARFAHSALVRADAVKVFADGVIEGDPMARPPTLPEAASLAPYRQPMFGLDAANKLVVTGFVDTGSEACVNARAQPQRLESQSSQQRFLRQHGFFAAQCRISSGRLQDSRAIILRYIELAHRAGFTIHVHCIGDAALRTAIDAIEAARSSDGIATQPDTLAHVQFAAPEDIARMGRDHLFIAFTYSWATSEFEYNMRVFPFLPDAQAPDKMYPTRSAKQAGAILVAGSDAPVADHDPIPFKNMAIAVTRTLPGNPPLNLSQSLSIREVLDAYTIDGARSLNREREIGSLEVGKSADFAVLDRNILQLGDSGRAAEIAQTQVLETWFQGKRVFKLN